MHLLSPLQAGKRVVFPLTAVVAVIVGLCLSPYLTVCISPFALLSTLILLLLYAAKAVHTH